jgi:hypothetical protein
LLTAAAAAASLFLAVGAADAVSIITDNPVAVTCTSTGQACDQAFQKSVTTSSTLTLEFQSAWDGCANFSVEFYIDGAKLFSSPALAPFASTGTIDAGPVAFGSHALEVRAIGVIGGCDSGTLSAWAGRFTAATTDDSPPPSPPPPPPATPPPPSESATPTSVEQCMKGGWKSFTAPAFKNQGQCVAFVVLQKFRRDRDDCRGSKDDRAERSTGSFDQREGSSSRSCRRRDD